MRGICVIFDLDGTLVDSEGLGNQAFLDLLPELNDTVESMTERYRGQKLTSIMVDLENRLCLRLPDTFERPYRQRVAELFANELNVMPGALEMLQAIKAPKCIASSGPLLKIRQPLPVSGLAPYFGDRLYSSYEVDSWKPESGLFQYAAQATGLISSRCAVVPDGEVGIEAAIAAGMTAFHSVQSATTAIGPSEDCVVFDEMSKLPRLQARYCQYDRLTVNHSKQRDTHGQAFHRIIRKTYPIYYRTETIFRWDGDCRQSREYFPKGHGFVEGVGLQPRRLVKHDGEWQRNLGSRPASAADDDDVLRI